MFLTKENIDEIAQRLKDLSVKDTDLSKTSSLNKSDIIAIVQDGDNKQISVDDFISQFNSMFNSEDIINVTNEYTTPNISLIDAIKIIPITKRKEGVIITFIDENNSWEMYQFTGILEQWNITSMWNQLFTMSLFDIATHTKNGLMSMNDKVKLDTIEENAQVNTVNSVAGKTGDVIVTKSDIGLGNADNTSDIDKPISKATQTALDTKVDKEENKVLVPSEDADKLAKLKSQEQFDTIQVLTDKNIKTNTDNIAINKKAISDNKEAIDEAIKKVNDRLTEVDTSTNEEFNIVHQNINDEVTRATNAESIITSNLNKEITRATNKENELSDSISTLQEKHNNYETSNNSEITKINNLTINGHKISSNPSLTKSDVNLTNVTNDAQVKRTEMGAANGVATLDTNSKIPVNQLPAYVSDIIEAATYSKLPSVGEKGKIYVTLDTNLTYRWSGTQYTEISKSLALGETEDTAFTGLRGKTLETNLTKEISDRETGDSTLKKEIDAESTSRVQDIATVKQSITDEVNNRTKADKTLQDNINTCSNNINVTNKSLDDHINNTNNPHSVTKFQVGLGNVDNTADADKEVLSATKLKTVRTIWGQNFNGSANVSGDLKEVSEIYLTDNSKYAEPVSDDEINTMLNELGI